MTSIQNETVDPSTPSTRHSEFWLHDGSIVLSVQDTLFKVHQTILANHSEVFADMFSMPQVQESGEEKEDGCSVVVLHDSADDFVDLLKAIYHPSHFDNLSPSADLDTLLTFISGILRLSTKYLIRELRKKCIAVLTGRFPTTYRDYLVRSPQSHPHTPDSSISASTFASDLTALANLINVILVPPPATPAASNQSVPLASQHSSFQAHHHGSNQPLNPQSQPQQPQPQPNTSTSRTHSKKSKSKANSVPPKPKASSVMRAIALADQTNVPLILPFAYYLLSRTSSPRRFLSHSSSSPLSWHQKTICLVGRALLHSAELSMSHVFLVAFQVAPRCTSPVQCRDARGPLAEWALLESAGKGPEPLRLWDRWDRLGVCNECVAEAQRKHERGREEVWERLPEFFDLGPWKQLKVAQDR